MACPSCNNPVASNARVCPKCGHRFTHPFVMIVAVIFGIMLLGSIVRVLSIASSSDSATVSSASAAQPLPKIAEDPKKKAVAARLDYAHTLEQHLLSIGLDAHVKVIGKQQDTLRISWTAMSRPVVYNMIKGEGMSKQVPELGFRKVIFTDEGRYFGQDVEMWAYHWDGSDWTQK